MADNGKSGESKGSSTIASRYGLVSRNSGSNSKARDCGWESGDSGDSLSYSD
jgi:hypothetical protein